MHKHLKKCYGYNEFRPTQKSVIKDILKGRDVIVVYPTGGGKSLCYQFPATYTSKISIVISPLISLMNDQKLKLNSMGVKSICLNGETYSSSGNFPNKTKKLLQLFEDVSVVYCTPEFITVNIDIFTKIIDKICLFAIDEAHCVSEWGHDFRVSYRKLNMIKEHFPHIPLISLTATATPMVMQDIFDSLNYEEIVQYRLGTKRNNLIISVKQKGLSVLEDLNINQDESTIIYAQTQKETERIHDILKSGGIKSECYHGGMSSQDKDTSHNNFVQDKVKILVATICFGMGIDKPDIRRIVNYGSPQNIETYYQEIGRAGRDGKDSVVDMFYEEKDFQTNLILFLSKNTKEFFS